MLRWEEQISNLELHQSVGSGLQSFSLRDLRGNKFSSVHNSSDRERGRISFHLEGYENTALFSSIWTVSERAMLLSQPHRQMSTSWSSSGQLHSYKSRQLAWLWFINSPSSWTVLSGASSHIFLNWSTRAASLYTCFVRW